MAKSRSTQSAGLQNATLESIAQSMKYANTPTKQLDGSFRFDFYCSKSEACSIALTKGRAVVNGVRADDTLRITSLTDVSVRVHIRHFTLSPDAKRVKVPAVASMADFLVARQIAV